MTADPGLGIVRHADAGYPEALDAARARRDADADARPRAGAEVSRASTAPLVADHGAGAVLRPPRDGLPHLRDAGRELRSSRASCRSPTAGSPASRPTPTPTLDDRRDRHERSPRARRLPHAPAVRGLARVGEYETKSPASPTRRSRARGAASRPPRARWRELGRGGARAVARRSPARCSRTARRRSSASRATASRARASCARCALATRARRSRPDDDLDRAPRPRRPAGHTADAGWTRSRRWCPGAGAAVSPRSTSSSSRSRSATTTWSGWVSWRATPASRCAARRAALDDALGALAFSAGARSVDHLSRSHPDDIAPLAAAECAAVLLPGAEFLGDEPRARRARCSTPARSSCSRPTSTPAPRRSSRCRS